MIFKYPFNRSVFVHRWLALFLSLKAAYRLHHQRLFNLEDEGPEEARHSQENGGRLKRRSTCLSRKDLILWLNRPTSFPNTHTSPVLQVRNTHSETDTWDSSFEPLAADAAGTFPRSISQCSDTWLALCPRSPLPTFHQLLKPVGEHWYHWTNIYIYTKEENIRLFF